MPYEDDLQLSFAEKFHLIQSIEYWQRESWKRLKKIHSFTHFNMIIRHYFMKREIALIRDQKQRLLQLQHAMKQEQKN